MNRGQNKQNQQTLQSATTGLQGSAADLSGFGGKLGEQAGGFLGDAQKTFRGANTQFNQAGDYYNRILSGNRGALDSVLAPDRAAITDTYRGAEKGLDRLQGGTRDLAFAELNRDRAGKLALLPSMARTAAAGGALDAGQGLTGVAGSQAGTGTTLTGQAVGAKGGSAGAYGNLFQGANYRSALQQQMDRETNQSIGTMIFDALKSRKPKAGSGGGGGVLPTSGTFGGGAMSPFPAGITPNRP